MNPALQLYIQHTKKAEFIIGVEKGHWGIVGEDPQCSTWPLVYLWVSAPERGNGSHRYYFRFDLTGYPAQAPTACPWDMQKGHKLAYEEWPGGGSIVNTVFRTDWNNGNSLYAPCDRLADLPGHPDWANTHTDFYWNSTRTIVTYLNFIYETINSGSYFGPKVAST